MRMNIYVTVAFLCIAVAVSHGAGVSLILFVLTMKCDIIILQMIRAMIRAWFTDDRYQRNYLPHFSYTSVPSKSVGVS